jgi:hypothetical protein
MIKWKPKQHLRSVIENYLEDMLVAFKVSYNMFNMEAYWHLFMV